MEDAVWALELAGVYVRAVSACEHNLRSPQIQIDVLIAEDETDMRRLTKLDRVAAGSSVPEAARSVFHTGIHSQGSELSFRQFFRK